MASPPASLTEAITRVSSVAVQELQHLRSGELRAIPGVKDKAGDRDVLVRVEGDEPAVRLRLADADVPGLVEAEPLEREPAALQRASRTSAGQRPMALTLCISFTPKESSGSSVRTGHCTRVILEGPSPVPEASFSRKFMISCGTRFPNTAGARDHGNPAECRARRRRGWHQPGPLQRLA
jgi:hypothetical protein